MLVRALLLLVVLAIAIGGGAASVWYALEDGYGLVAIRVGPWSAFPDLGMPDGSPYAKAQVARDGALALGRAEGLAFSAHHDGRGAVLDRRCTYRIAGRTPAARLWTLYAADRALAPIAVPPGERPAALHSAALLYEAGNRFLVTVSPYPAPGNWLRVPAGGGPLALVLTLYDTPAAAASDIRRLELPQIEKAGCDDG